MAVIHHTVLKPNKLELLTAWLPSRPWYVGGAREPRLALAGGFRLDDPQGAVGIEFMVVNDASGPHPTTYLAPLTYRGAPLDDAEHALVGTMEHGVLGQRWVYDCCHDPVGVAQLLALTEGRVQAQDQDVSETTDPEVIVTYTGEHSPATDLTALTTDDQEGTELTTPHGTTLRLHRAPHPDPNSPASPPPGAIGHLTGPWQTPDGTHTRGTFAVLYPTAQR